MSSPFIAPSTVAFRWLQAKRHAQGVAEVSCIVGLSSVGRKAEGVGQMKLSQIPKCWSRDVLGAIGEIENKIQAKKG